MIGFTSETLVRPETVLPTFMENVDTPENAMHGI